MQTTKPISKDNENLQKVELSIREKIAEKLRKKEVSCNTCHKTISKNIFISWSYGPKSKISKFFKSKDTFTKPEHLKKASNVLANLRYIKTSCSRCHKKLWDTIYKDVPEIPKETHKDFITFQKKHPGINYIETLLP